MPRSESSSVAKYRKTRPSPRISAQDPAVRGKVRVGNDGNLYKSKPDINGNFHWKPVKSGVSVSVKKKSSIKSTKSKSTPGFKGVGESLVRAAKRLADAVKSRKSKGTYTAAHKAEVKRYIDAVKSHLAH